MSRIYLVAILVSAMCSAANAGTISGKVSGVSCESVVYVDVIQGKTFPAPGDHPLIDQKGLMFTPHITVVQVGTTVDFLNSDSVAHNVFWTSVGGNKKLTHNLGTWPKGEKRSFKFDNPGAVPLLCNVHPEMSGYIFVVPTPYFAVTDKDGNFVIKNVPPGQYTLKTGSENGKPASQSVTVAGAPINVSLTVTK